MGSVEMKILPFLEVFEDVSAGNTKIKQADYLSAGTLPIVDQGQSLIGGYSNDQNSTCKADLPVVIFGDHTRVVKFIDFPFALGADGVKVLKNKCQADVKYLYYCLKNSKIPDTGYNRHFKFLKELKIPLPPLPIQKKIAAVLEKADELKRKREEQIKRLDDLLQATFLDMFGDPVTNPKGWPVGHIRDMIASTHYGTSAKASDAGEFPILRMGNITYKGDWDFSDLKYIDLTEEEQKKYLVHSGEILFNRTNSRELVGKTAVYRKSRPMAFAGYLIKLKENEKGNPEFISAYLNSAYVKEFMLNKCKSIVGMANINAQEVQKIPAILPPKRLQDDFAKRVEAILENKRALSSRMESLESLFNSLMQRAFKGELDLK
jgi:type I restriction enzyme S subunit